MEDQPNNNVFWLEDPAVLFRNGNFYRFIPHLGMTKIEVLNSLTLLFIYIAVICILLTGLSGYVYIPLIAIVVIIIIYYTQYYPVGSLEKFEDDDTSDVEDANPKPEKKHCKNDDLETCQKPTEDNPFMNLTMADSMDRPDRPKACPPTKKIRSEINKQLQKLLRNKYAKTRDSDQHQKYFERQFYTMPVTTTVNDQTAFAKYLYDSPKTCKEDSAHCLRYEDVRFSRYNPEIDKPEKTN